LRLPVNINVSMNEVNCRRTILCISVITGFVITWCYLVITGITVNLILRVKKYCLTNSLVKSDI